MKKRLIPMLMVPIMAMAASCVHDNEIERITPDGTGPIRIVATDEGATRGTPITDAAALTDMGVYCSFTGTSDWTTSDAPGKMFNEEMRQDSGEWVYANSDVYWGATDLSHRYTFFGYTPYATAGNGIVVNGSSATAGTPTLTYTVPTDVLKQPDLMVAVPKKNVRPTGVAVPLAMKHALTSVGFTVVAEDAGKKLTGISVSGVSVTGTVAMDGETIAWSGLGAPVTTNFAASLDYDGGQNYYTVPTGTAGNPIAGDGYLMMIPQTLTSSAKVTLTFDGEADRVIDLGTHAWVAGEKVNYSITLLADGDITIGPTAVTIPYLAGVGGSFSVTCRKADGTEADLPWSFSVPESATWLKLSTSPTATWETAAATVTGTGSATIYLVVQENSSTTANRTATVTLDGTSEGVTVTQLRKVMAVMPNSYVGAFWKNDQTGERVIKIDVETINLGDWSASVMWMDAQWAAGDIVLAEGFGTSSGVLYTPDPGDAEDYRVGGTSTIARGTASGSDPRIVFRIGLKSEYTPTGAYPARYAVVALSYNGGAKTQLLYLRQGEGDDYLMRPNDPGIGVDTRPLAKKISPYNLTHSSFKSSASTVHRFTTPARGGKMVEYPTQAGAFWKWAEQDGVVAYNPAVPAYNPSGWNTYYVKTYWNNTGTDNTNQTYDGCPTGYRRWNDGSQTNTEAVTLANVDASNSEMGQSLYVDPPTGDTSPGNIDNSVWGYYADGWFDRRNITQQEVADTNSSAANSAVSTDNSAVAYIGRLFFNPATNASLFFPASGYRLSSSGRLHAPGVSGYYWSSGSATEESGIQLRFFINAAHRGQTSRIHGQAVRCVVDE